MAHNALPELVKIVVVIHTAILYRQLYVRAVVAAVEVLAYGVQAM